MRIIDTGDKILSSDNHPNLKIGSKCYVVDDRKTTWNKIQKIQADDSVTDQDEQILILALGKEAFKEITKDISVEGFINLTFYVLSAITGEDFETLKSAAAEQRKN